MKSFLSLLLLTGCLDQSAGDAASLSLGFGTYAASPVVMTHFSIEQPLATVPVALVSTEADIPGTLGGRTAGTAALSLPDDIEDDRVWRIRAQWVELRTDKAWRGEVAVPIREIRTYSQTAQVNVIFGPNGQLLIGSDAPTPDPSGYQDVGQTCGVRIPAADRKWQRESDQLTGLSYVLEADLPPVTDPVCPFPAE